jgi:hypothetical protein
VHDRRAGGRSRYSARALPTALLVSCTFTIDSLCMFEALTPELLLHCSPPLSACAALDMVRSDESLLRAWVALRPLLAIPPWPALVIAYAVTCAVAYMWR